MLQDVQETVFKGLDALHVTCGASHSEFRIEPHTGRIQLIEIGARADLILLDDLKDFHVSNVWIDGELVASDGKYLLISSNNSLLFSASDR